MHRRSAHRPGPQRLRAGAPAKAGSGEREAETQPGKPVGLAERAQQQQAGPAWQATGARLHPSRSAKASSTTSKPPLRVASAIGQGQQRRRVDASLPSGLFGRTTTVTTSALRPGSPPRTPHGPPTPRRRHVRHRWGTAPTLTRRVDSRRGSRWIKRLRARCGRHGRLDRPCHRHAQPRPPAPSPAPVPAARAARHRQGSGGTG